MTKCLHIGLSPVRAAIHNSDGDIIVKNNWLCPICRTSFFFDKDGNMQLLVPITPTLFIPWYRRV